MVNPGIVVNKKMRSQCVDRRHAKIRIPGLCVSDSGSSYYANLVQITQSFKKSFQ